VALFFVISGYVITMTLERIARPADFAVGRLARLAPAYWVDVLLTFAVVSLLGLPEWEATPGDALVNLTLLQSFLDRPDVDEVYWTLAFEVTFYGLMAALWFSPLRRHLMPVLWLWLGMVVAYELLEPMLPNLAAQVWRKLLVLKFANLFIAGIVMRELTVHGASKGRLALLAACVAVQALHPDLMPWPLALGIVIVVLLAVRGRIPLLASPAMLWLGAISYTLYLGHQNMGYAVLLRLRELGVQPELAVALVTGGAIGLATIYSNVVERPAMHAIRGWWRQLSTGPRAARQAGQAVVRQGWSGPSGTA
jgi:peptidoglycan/LPS O-acetylase OafA/YrhL